MSEIVNSTNDTQDLINTNDELILTKTNSYGFSKKIPKSKFLEEICLRISSFREENFNKIIQYCQSSKAKCDIEDFIKKVITNFWIQYQCDKSENKLEKIYEAAVYLLPLRFREFLKDEIAYAVLQENISKLYYENVPDVVIIEELKEFNSISKRIKNFAACYLPTTTQLILAMKKFDQDWVDRTFARIELKLQQSVTLKSMVIGKLGTGKSTIISAIEGFLSNINNTPITERCISNNGRGTEKITTTNIKVGNISLFFDDTVGQGDPGKGYSQEELWNDIREYYKSDDSGSIKSLDLIQYTLDASIPRLDNTDFTTLEHFIMEFKHNYPDSLNWWNKVVIMLTKANMIKLVDYSSTNGVPKYESKAWAKENDIKFGVESVLRYNEVYKEKLIPVLAEWAEEVRTRIYEKVHRNDKSYEDGGESFAAYFNYLAKKHYPNLSESEIKKFSDNFDVVLVGEASKREDAVTNWDFKGCEIKPIPNFKDAIPEMFDIKEIEEHMETLVYTKNWFDDLMNKIYAKFKNDNFRLTILRLNEQSKVAEELTTNNNVNLDRSAAVTADTYQRTTHEVADNMIINFIAAIVSWIGGLFSGW
jgi:hypothetical protein